MLGEGVGMGQDDGNTPDTLKQAQEPASVAFVRVLIKDFSINGRHYACPTPYCKDLATADGLHVNQPVFQSGPVPH